MFAFDFSAPVDGGEGLGWLLDVGVGVGVARLNFLDGRAERMGGAEYRDGRA